MDDGNFELPVCLGRLISQCARDFMEIGGRRRNLLQHEFRGKEFLVNPQLRTCLGH